MGDDDAKLYTGCLIGCLIVIVLALLAGLLAIIWKLAVWVFTLVQQFVGS